MKILEGFIQIIHKAKVLWRRKRVFTTSFFLLNKRCAITMRSMYPASPGFLNLPTSMFKPGASFSIDFLHLFPPYQFTLLYHIEVAFSRKSDKESVINPAWPIPSFESAKIHAKVRPRYVVFAILRLSYPLGLPQRPPSVAVMREWQGLHNAMRFSGS